MKKIIALVLLVFLFSMFACGDTDTMTTTTDTVKESQPNNETTTNPNNLDPNGGERPLATISSMEEYQKIVNANILPQSFIPYEKISRFGTFQSLVFLSDTLSGDYSAYMYNLTDATEYDISVSIDHNNKEKSDLLPDQITNVNLSDMRQLFSTANGSYICEGMTYKYVSGKLLSVSWQSNGVIYTLSGTSMLYDYSITDTTVVGKLLNFNTAVDTLNTTFNIDK